MNQIKFPGLGLDLNITPIAFKIFNIEIYWYAIIIVLAFTVAILFLKKDSGKYNIKFDNLLELILIIIPISIISARLYYVVFKFDYYIENPFEILNIRNGGLAIYGGIIGGIITILIYCKKKKINILDTFDYIVPYIPLAQSIRKMGKLH